MYSDNGNRRCRRLGSPIRTSPDHRLCASPRGFSQLTTSFFAFLRLGIPTHALSSLTIKSISDTLALALAPYSRHAHLLWMKRPRPSTGELMYAHLVFNCQRSGTTEKIVLVGLGRFELPTSPLSGVRSNQLSYRPLLRHVCGYGG